jgi:uncharacterized protein YjdB
MEPDLEQKLPGLLDVAAGQMADGIGAAMKELHNVKSFPDLDPEAVVTLQRCNKTDPDTGEPVCTLTVAEKRGINTALQELANSKIKGSWQDSLIENGDVTSGLIERSVTFDGIDTLTATGLASTSYATELIVADVDVDAGQTVQLVPQPQGPDGVAVTVTYETSDASVATVDSTGKVTGVAAGTTTIRVRATFGCSLQDPLIQVGEATVTVNAGATAPKQCSASTYGETLTVPAVSVTPGSTAQLAVSASGPAGVTPTYTYASDDTSIATVDASGLVTGVSAGDAKVTVTATYRCGPDDTLVQVGESTATVTEAPQVKQCLASTYGETLTVANVTVARGSTVQLAPQASGPAGVAPTYTYVSDDQSVATVDASGLVTGVTAGDAKITVRANYTCGPDDSLVQVGEATATVECDFSCALRDVLGQVRLLIARLLAIFASIGA